MSPSTPQIGRNTSETEASKISSNTLFSKTTNLITLTEFQQRKPRCREELPIQAFPNQAGHKFASPTLPGRLIAREKVKQKTKLLTAMRRM